MEKNVKKACNSHKSATGDDADTEPDAVSAHLGSLPCPDGLTELPSTSAVDAE